MLLAEISSEDVATLTRILQLLPHEDGITHSNRIFAEFSSLSSDLRRPNRFSRLILPPQNSFTPLCALHKPLDASLVHALFQLLTLEVSVRLNTLVCNSNRLTPEQLFRVESLQQLHTVLTPPAMYGKTFLEKASNSKYAHQSDKCEACTLARMAGDLDTLLNLRMVLYSRQSKKVIREHGLPQYTRWVEAWIMNLTKPLLNMEEEEFGFMMRKNDSDARALKKVRKQIWHGKKSRKASTLATSNTDSHVHTAPEGPSDHEAEHSIIDHYAALISTPHLPSFQSSEISLVSPKTKRPVPQHQPLQPIPQPPTLSSGHVETVTSLRVSPEDEPVRVPEVYVAPRSTPAWKEPKPTSRPSLDNASNSQPVAPQPAPKTMGKYQLKMTVIARENSVFRGHHARADSYADSYRNALSPPPTTPAMPTAAFPMDSRKQSEWTDLSLPHDSCVSLIPDTREAAGQSRAEAAAAAATSTSSAPPVPPIPAMSALRARPTAPTAASAPAQPPTRAPCSKPVARRPDLVMDGPIGIPPLSPSSKAREEEAKCESQVQARIAQLHRSSASIGAQRTPSTSISDTPGSPGSATSGATDTMTSRTSWRADESNSSMSAQTASTTWSRIYKSAGGGGGF